MPHAIAEESPLRQHFTSISEVSSIPLYELNEHGLTAIEPGSFAAEGLRERHDIQQLLRAQIDCLEDGPAG